MSNDTTQTLATMTHLAKTARQQLEAAIAELDNAIAAGEAGNKNLLVGNILTARESLETAASCASVICKLQSARV